MSFPIDWVRDHFPALARRHEGQNAIFLDGPAGSQVPASVAAAVSNYLLSMNANHGGCFATGIETDAMLSEAHQAVADFLGTDDPDCVSFGPNMTTLTLALSRALARTWQAGDEIIVSQLDHDANVTPWRLAAADAGVTVREIKLNTDDCTLCLDSLAEHLSSKTRLVAVGYAANGTGTINPIRQITQLAHDVGALTFVDAVHYGPHGLIDVSEIGCDFLTVSAYKFFGPHVGVLYGRRELLESTQPYKLRPAPNDLPGRWMTGTQNHEGIAGTAAAVEYLADLGRELDPSANTRRGALSAAFGAITEYERTLSAQLIHGIGSIPGARIHGITDSNKLTDRVPTISATFAGRAPRALAAGLAERGIFTWAGNHYALPFTEAAGLEPEGTLRIGALHYNTREEIDRTIAALQELC